MALTPPRFVVYEADSPKAERFGRVARAVVELLLHGEPSSVTVSAVARRAGVSRPWIYKYVGKERGELLVEPGTEVYEGMVVGERNRAGDLVVNITREKKLTNIRSSTADVLETLRPPHRLSLDQAIEFIAADEYVEVTPSSLRIRKSELSASKREQLRKRLEKFRAQQQQASEAS